MRYLIVVVSKIIIQYEFMLYTQKTRQVGCRWMASEKCGGRL